MTWILNMERTVQRIVANCDTVAFNHEPYLDLEVFGKILIDTTINTASVEIKEVTELPIVYQPPRPPKPFYLNVEWPTISSFTVDECNSKIEEFCKMWLHLEEWLFCIDLISEASDDCSTFYLYEVKWSIPTKPYPIPHAVASVFFTVDVSKIHPGECPVKVTYVFEGSRLTHTPGKINFQVKWLLDIIDSKTMFFTSLEF